MIFLQPSNRGKIVAAITFVAVGLFWSGIAQAQSIETEHNVTGSAAKPQVFGDWQVTCSKEQKCRMSQTVAQPATARAIIQVKVFKGDDPTLLVSFPLGILLSTGWRYSVDDRAETVLPFEICDAAGCHAGVKLSQKMLTSMKRGNNMKITFFDAGRTRVEPVLSLAGFTKAWAHLE